VVKTPSNMPPLGMAAPDFNLPDAVTGNMVSLDDVKSDRATVIMFICNHCPFVKHINEGLVRLVNDYQPKGISFAAINANDVEHYPEDSPDMMKKTAHELGYAFPYLFDETQATARAYDAACTPDFYVFDAGLRLIYRGQFDDSRPGNGIPVTGRDMRAALDSIIGGRPVNPDQKPSLGCNIKWKSG